MLYKMTIKKEGGNVKTLKKSEAMLKDLLDILPTLKRHKIDAEVTEKVRKLRDGRKSKSFVLELSRDFQGKKLEASAKISKTEDKMQVLKELKEQIRGDIQKIRKESKPPIETFSFREGVQVQKLAEVYLEPGSFIKVMARKIRLDMSKGKKPTTADNYIGVEIELASTNNREFICDRLYEAGLGKFVTVKDDGSIRREPDYPHAHEICVLARQSEIEDIITRLCKVLNDLCNVRVDKSCGLHVHVDMRSRDVAKAFNNLVSSQQMLYAMLPAARRNSKYSYPVKGTKWRVLDERYHGINSQAYSKYQTLEARMHCGTTQGSKINNWIKLLIAISDAPMITTPPVTVAQLKEFTGISDELADYVTARIAKFKSQHKNNKPEAEEPGTMPEVAELIGIPPMDVTVTEQSEVA